VTRLTRTTSTAGGAGEGFFRTAAILAGVVVALACGSLHQLLRSWLHFAFLARDRGGPALSFMTELFA
jgi:hypothetical protein